MSQKKLGLAIDDQQNDGEYPAYCFIAVDDTFVSRLTFLRDLCKQHAITECRQQSQAVDFDPQGTRHASGILTVNDTDFSIIFEEYSGGFDAMIWDRAKTRPMAIADLLSLVENAAPDEEFLFYEEEDGAMDMAREAVEKYQSRSAPSV